MNFVDWWTQRETVAGGALNGADNANAAWDYQQERIDELKSQLEAEDEYRKQIEKLEWDLADVRNALKNRIAVSDKGAVDSDLPVSLADLSSVCHAYVPLKEVD